MKRFLILPALLVSVVLFSCRKQDLAQNSLFNGSINSVEPLTGSRGDTITIKGSGFTANGPLVVYLNGHRALVTIYNDSLIRFLVPIRAGSGLVSVAADNGGLSGPWFNFVYTVSVSTVAGQAGQAGFADGQGTTSRFSLPSGLCSDSLGNIYVADEGNNCIRRVSPGGFTVTFAGNQQAGYQDGSALASRFNAPSGIDWNPETGFFYVADRLNHCIRRIASTGDVTTFAGVPSVSGYVDAPAPGARFNNPADISFDSDYDFLYITDPGNHCIRRIDASMNVVTLAGGLWSGNLNGTGTGSRFAAPVSIICDSSLRVLVVDSSNHNIRSIDRVGALVSTLSGMGYSGFINGDADSALFSNPSGICLFGKSLLIADASNHCIRMILPEGKVITLAGNGSQGSSDGSGMQASFNRPVSIVESFEGEFYIADQGNHCIRKMILE